VKDILPQDTNLTVKTKQKISSFTILLTIEDLIEKGLFSEAEKNLMALLADEVVSDPEIKSKMRTAVFYLAKTLINEKKYEKAVRFLESLCADFKHNAEYFSLLGKSFNGAGDTKNAISILEEGCYRFQDNIELYCALFDAFDFDGKPLHAVNVLRKLTLSTNSPLAYRNALQKIISRKTGNADKNKIKFALLSNFTFDQIEIYLELECRLINIKPEFYKAGYDMYNQEMLDLYSGLYGFQPDIVLLAIHTRQFFSELYYELCEIETRKLWQLARDRFDTLDKSISFYANNSKATILINRFTLPTYSPFSINDLMEKNSQERVVNYLNKRLLSLCRKHGNKIKIVDTERTLSKVGKEFAADETKRTLAKVEIAARAMPFIARDYMRFVKAIKFKNRKCIVLDLDNTLWGGIVGEDGFENIKLGIEPPGNAYVEFQKLLKSYFSKGIILAINSKNNFDDAIEVIRDHPDMILREEHFACVKINWKSKVDNLLEIAEEINLNLDSFIFVDDNPAERKLIRDKLPEVLVPEMPKDPSGYTEVLNKLNDLDTLYLTEEDKKRGKMYMGEIKRKYLKESTQTLEEYLETLKMKAHIFQADKFTLPRITQLINKTNQFNLTTKRYSEGELRCLAEASSSDVYGLKVKDIFGDIGIVGVIINKKEDNCWYLDTFLMSCRVLGRKLEDFFLDYIIGQATKNGVREVWGRYIRTRKNSIVKSFYNDFGFSPAGTENDAKLYSIGVSDYEPKSMKFIEIDKI
jgi:FkbH-like protein